MPAEPKTPPTAVDPLAFIGMVEDAAKRADCLRIDAMMRDIANDAPKMWGPAIVGYGSRALSYATGRQLDWPLLAFSPRKANITLYMAEYIDPEDVLWKALGKHTVGKACLYIKRLADVDMGVLEALLRRSAELALQPESDFGHGGLE